MQVANKIVRMPRGLAPRLALAAIILLSAFLNLYRLNTIGINGIGNYYYAAAVQTMLSSWRHFFFLSVDPAGFISLDKPPLADVFRLYRPAFPGQVVPLEVSSPPLVEDISTVDAACLRTLRADWLFLANRSLSESAEVEVGDFAPFDESLILVGESPQGRFERGQATVKGGLVILPPLSIMRLRKHRPSHAG